MAPAEPERGADEVAARDDVAVGRDEDGAYLTETLERLDELVDIVALLRLDEIFDLGDRTEMVAETLVACPDGGWSEVAEDGNGRERLAAFGVGGWRCSSWGGLGFRLRLEPGVEETILRERILGRQHWVYSLDFISDRVVSDDPRTREEILVMAEKVKKPRRPRRELTAKETETVMKRVSEGAPYSKIAAEINAAEYADELTHQPLYDAVRRAAIEKLGGQDEAIAAKKAAREAAKAPAAAPA